MTEVIYVLSGEIAWFDHMQKFGDQFEVSYEHAISLLEQFPEMAPIFEVSPFRKLIISQTTWANFYAVEGKRIVIHTILDLRQDPERIRQILTNLLP